ncbi:MAG TPA: CinA family protein [Burkholderiaceae bacterium]|nr:CinA family protein [Burkholderiaceae bacterium]
MLQSIVRYLEQHQLTVVTAESCTAGLIASRLAEPPGAGKWLDCAFVSYSEGAKIKCLHVDESIIENHGLTSEAVARAMAEGALHAAEANLALATTGVAGPSSGDGQQEVGTVCLAWSFAREDGRIYSFSEQTRFDGDRNAVRDAAAAYALECIPHYHRAAIQQATAK